MQPSIGPKVCNLLGDERMTTFTCTCGTKIARMHTSNKRYLGVCCSWCRASWRTIAVPVAVCENYVQHSLFYQYYSCTCGAKSLNRPPKLTKCICVPGELR